MSNVYSQITKKKKKNSKYYVISTFFIGKFCIYLQKADNIQY